MRRVLIHGEPTWSYLFRKQIPVAERHRVIAVDHMGFGKSAAPQDRTYWLQDHIDNLERLVLALDLRDLTLVMHDFGGPAGMGLAIRHPHRIKRIISVNGPTPAGQSDVIDRVTANGAVSPWFQWILKAEKEDILEQVLGQLDYNILSTLKLNGFVDNSLITDTWLRAYRAPFPTPAHAAGCHWLGKRLRHQCAPIRAAGTGRRGGPLRPSLRWQFGASRTGRCTLSTSCRCLRRRSRMGSSGSWGMPVTTARRTRPPTSRSWSFGSCKDGR